MNKNDIKQIILEEIEAAINEMGSPEELAADSRPEEEDFNQDDAMDMARDFNDEQDAIFGKPNFVEEEGLEEMARTSNIFKLSQEASLQDVLQFMQRVNDVLKTYKSPGQKRPKKRFTPEEMKALATAMLNPEGFTSKDVIAATSYNSPAQANKFLKALEMKGLITLTSQLKKSMTPDRDPNAPETRGRKRKGAEFDMADDPTGMDFGDFDDLDLSDPLAEISSDVAMSAANKAYRRGERQRAKDMASLFFSKFVGKEFPGLGVLERVEFIDDAAEEGFQLGFKDSEMSVKYTIDHIGYEYLKGVGKGGTTIPVKNMSPVSRKTIRMIQLMIQKFNPDSEMLAGTQGFMPVAGLRENNNTMSELEKYIKQQIKEAKNPLAKKMKEIETQGRVAALETKLAAVAEMIEETEGRLTRIDEDNEFRDMMDKNAVKEVRKQLKELERAQAKLQKEYDKLSSGRKKEKVVDELDAEETRAKADKFDDLADRQDALDQEAGEVEEVSFELNESTLRMQKLAGLITESDIKKKLSLTENTNPAVINFLDKHTPEEAPGSWDDVNNEFVVPYNHEELGYSEVDVKDFLYDTGLTLADLPTEYVEITNYQVGDQNRPITARNFAKYVPGKGLYYKMTTEPA